MRPSNSPGWPARHRRRPGGANDTSKRLDCARPTQAATGRPRPDRKLNLERSRAGSGAFQGAGSGRFSAGSPLMQFAHQRPSGILERQPGRRLVSSSWLGFATNNVQPFWISMQMRCPSALFPSLPMGLHRQSLLLLSLSVRRVLSPTHQTGCRLRPGHSKRVQSRTSGRSVAPDQGLALLLRFDSSAPSRTNQLRCPRAKPRRKHPGQVNRPCKSERVCLSRLRNLTWGLANMPASQRAR